MIHYVSALGFKTVGYSRAKTTPQTSETAYQPATTVAVSLLGKVSSCRVTLAALCASDVPVRANDVISLQPKRV